MPDREGKSEANAYRTIEAVWRMESAGLIAALYDALARVAPSPVVEINRAVALSMAFGPAVGLDLIDRLAAEPALRSYHLLPSVRGDFLIKLGRLDEARLELERAAALTRNERERQLLLQRAARLLQG